MARARSKRTRRRRRAPTTRRAAKPSEAETRLLGLARELPDAAGTGAALRRLADAYAPDAPLPRALAQAWLRSRDDKNAALALAWAREQVRLALEDVLGRAPALRAALGGDAPSRAWVLLAAIEAIAQEPPSAAADRLRTLLELTGSD